MTSERLFFVLRLGERDYRLVPDVEYAVQLLDADGQAVAEGFLRPNDTVLEIQGRPVPGPVLEAARRQAKGKGDYVDEAGHSVKPF